MPTFCQCGSDEVVCQKCARVVCSNENSAYLNGKNYCSDCAALVGAENTDTDDGKVYFTGTAISVKTKYNRQGHPYAGVMVRVDATHKVWFARPMMGEAADKGLVAVTRGDDVSGFGELSKRDGDMTFLNHVWLEGDPEPVDLSTKTPTDNDTHFPTATARERRGTYTYVFDNGERRTIRVDAVPEGDEDADTYTGDRSFAGWTFVKYLSGPDNERSYTNFAYARPGDPTLSWKAKFHDRNGLVAVAFEALMTATLEDAHELGVTWARESGQCYVCGRKLTTPESITDGIGPVCAGKRQSQFSGGGVGATWDTTGTAS